MSEGVKLELFEFQNAITPKLVNINAFKNLERLNDAYSKFFLYFENAPLLIINASDIDLESGGSDYDMLINKIMSDPRGKNFINREKQVCLF